MNWNHYSTAYSRHRRSVASTTISLAFLVLTLLLVPATSRAQSFYVAGGIAVAGSADIINKVDSNGTVSLFATLPANVSPSGVAVDSGGNLYAAVEATSGPQIIKIYPGGTVSLFATMPSGSGLNGLTFDGSGNLYVASDSNDLIFRVTPDGAVSTFATLPAGSLPMGLAFDGSGNLCVADYRADSGPAHIFKISSDGTVSTFATLPAGSFPVGLAIDGSGNLFAADSQTFQISKITVDGTVSDFADLPINSFPAGLAFDNGGNLCVTLNPGEISKITPDGTVSTFATGISPGFIGFIIPAPVVELTPIATEGGFSGNGSVSLNIPASTPEAIVVLSSTNSSLVAVPTSVSYPQGSTAMNFNVTTTPVTVTTVVPITATYNGTTVSADVTLSPAPAISISGLSGPEVAGGSPMPVTVSLNNFPRAATGVVINLSSSDTATLNISPVVTVPYGAFSATVTATTSAVSVLKNVILTATLNGSTITTTVTVRPIPKVTITQADYLTDTHEFRVVATTSTPASTAIMTFGGSPDGGALGTMHFESGAFRGSVILGAAPRQATVWDSLGGMATLAVRLKTSTAFTLSIGRANAGTVTGTPAGNDKAIICGSNCSAKFTEGTTVMLTATPAAGLHFVNWAGACSGTSPICSVAINKDTSVQANFAK